MYTPADRLLVHYLCALAVSAGGDCPSELRMMALPVEGWCIVLCQACDVLYSMSRLHYNTLLPLNSSRSSPDSQVQGISLCPFR